MYCTFNFSLPFLSAITFHYNTLLDMQAISDPASPNLESSNDCPPRPAKRKRYTPLACEQCKRRKVKCDGKIPCHRCARLDAECNYIQRGNNVESRQEFEWKKMNEKILKLQEQISFLVSNAASGVPSMHQLAPANPDSTILRDYSRPPSESGNGELPRSAYTCKTPRPKRHSQYMGPTSSSFTFGVAKSSLQGMGIQAGDDPPSGYSTANSRGLPTPNRVSPASDPLYTIPQNEALRLIATYEEESGSIYPFLNNELVLKATQEVYNTASLGRKSSILLGSKDENVFSGGMLDIVKLVIAIALVIEAGGPTVLSTELLESVESGFEGRFCGLSLDISGIQALTLMSILQFQCNEEVLAWRVIGFASKAAIELGLHRREMYFANFKDHEMRLWANKTFWCIYVLDRRWSFGTGLPFTIQDHDIDPELPKPSDPDSSLLKTMIAYGNIGSKVWRATAESNVSVKTEKVAFLDFQVQEWQSSITPELQLHSRGDDMLEGHSRTTNRIRVLLYLRANQMRLLLFRRSLFTPKTINDDILGAERVVGVAKDSIRVIHKLNQLSDIYSSQQTAFNYFLVSALGVLFLAVCHAATHFNETCREEFGMALDLVRGFSAKSYVAKKLWKSIKHLKVIGPKLGILPNQDQGAEKRGDIQEADIFQGRPLFENPTFPTGNVEDMNYLEALPLGTEVSPTYSYPEDGNQLSNELTNLFDAIETVYSDIPLQPIDSQRDFGFYHQETPEELSRSLLHLF
ncbi:fungal-specific transcription factor domain-containing protein [Halenospora varia]|nr:fungal-specific transcription factor domain-containing protein [Halenospora varia]